jgi:hypothetical protein
LWKNEIIQDIENYIKQRNVIFLSVDNRETNIKIKVKDMGNKLEDHEKE